MDDNSASAWLSDYKCSRLKSMGWCTDTVNGGVHQYNAYKKEKTTHRCPLSCGKCSSSGEGTRQAVPSGKGTRQAVPSGEGTRQAVPEVSSRKCDTKEGCLQEFGGTTDCTARGGEVKTVALKQGGGWTTIGAYPMGSRSTRGKTGALDAYFIYLRLGSQQYPCKTTFEKFS